jgi:hypothetical protein
VRHIDGAPKGIGKLFRRRPATGAGVHEHQRIRPVVAEVKFPVHVERKVFARRLGGGQLCDPKRGARADDKGANSCNDFHFQIQNAINLAARRTFAPP